MLLSKISALYKKYNQILLQYARITSYNVCYTKLLRYAIQCGWKDGGLKHVLKVFTNNKAKALDVSVLGSDEMIKWENTKDGLVVHQPEVMPQEGQAAIVYKITIAQ